MTVSASSHSPKLTMSRLFCCCWVQGLSEGLAQRERKVAIERSELDQQRRFQDKQAAQLVSVTQLAALAIACLVCS